MDRKISINKPLSIPHFRIQQHQARVGAPQAFQFLILGYGKSSYYAIADYVFQFLILGYADNVNNSGEKESFNSSF